MSTEASQLVLVKQFADEAEKMLDRQSAFGDGQAVSLMQDAVELIIRVIVRSRHIEVQQRATLDQMADAIGKAAVDDLGKVPHRARIDDLNKARVGFKHSGTAPSREDAVRLVRYGIEFLEVTVPRFFNIEYRKISLIQSIRATEVADLLESASAAAVDGRLQDAMIDASHAVGLIEDSLLKIMPLPTTPIRASGSDARAIEDLLKYLSGLRLVAVAAMMQFDLRELMKFRQIAPKVHGRSRGSRQAVFTSQVQYTAEQVDAAITFATYFALAVQSRIQ